MTLGIFIGMAVATAVLLGVGVYLFVQRIRW